MVAEGENLRLVVSETHNTCMQIGLVLSSLFIKWIAQCNELMQLTDPEMRADLHQGFVLPKPNLLFDDQNYHKERKIVI